MLQFFVHLDNKYNDVEQICIELGCESITELDVNRIYRYIESITC